MLPRTLARHHPSRRTVLQWGAAGAGLLAAGPGRAQLGTLADGPEPPRLALLIGNREYPGGEDGRGDEVGCCGEAAGHELLAKADASALIDPQRRSIGAEQIVGGVNAEQYGNWRSENGEVGATGKPHRLQQRKDRSDDHGHDER